MRKRNINIDLIKCIAVFSVISVHFFLNSGFYSKIITDKMYIAIIFRTLFMILCTIIYDNNGISYEKQDIK